MWAHFSQVFDIHTNQAYLPGNIVFFLGTWTFWVCMCSADREIPSLFSMYWITFVDEVVMTLRLWALYNRSRFILGSVLMFYLMEIISSFVGFVVFSKSSGYNSAGKLQ